ncbi:hypothetical protein KSS87_007603 [Heliosperma pusillum]|nr:hypothetical protein KSS87_007603 [Heliosperma pusillum]
MSSVAAAAPFWRTAGMTYISYSNICANLVRNCLKEPFKSEAIAREKVYYSLSKWDQGSPQKPSLMSYTPPVGGYDVSTLFTRKPMYTIE